MDNISRRIVPRLLEQGATDDQIHQLMVLNPARVLSPSAPSE
jgi:predicted metal-dependent phosphotriesterase family hydrolase